MSSAVAKSGNPLTASPNHINNTTQTHDRGVIDRVAEQSLQKKWDVLREADLKNDLKEVTAAAFAYLLAHLDSDERLSTGEAIVQLEQRLRKENMNTYCIARDTVAPYRSSTHDKRPTPYHLYLSCRTKAKTKREREEVSGSRLDNLERLSACGFLESRTEEQAREKQQLAVRLPMDLKHDSAPNNDNFYVNTDSVHAYIGGSAEDLNGTREGNELIEKIREHSQTTARGDISEALRFTGVQAVRTSVPSERWEKTKTALDQSVNQRLPIAECAVFGPALREQLVPVAYNVLGRTNLPPEITNVPTPTITSGNNSNSSNAAEHVLFDLYAVTERKYHINLSDADRAWLEQQSNTAEQEGSEDVIALQQLHELIANAASTVVEEVSIINFFNWKRHVALLQK